MEDDVLKSTRFNPQQSLQPQPSLVRSFEIYLLCTVV